MNGLCSLKDKKVTGGGFDFSKILNFTILKSSLLGQPNQKVLILKFVAILNIYLWQKFCFD